MPDYFVPYEGSEPFVFVSYAHKDTETVLPLIRGLHNRGVRVWYDGGVEVGTEWPDFIAEHLEKSYCVLAFVSRNFGDSHNCRREINFAIEERKEPIVIYLEPKEVLKAGMRMQLGSLHALYYDRYPNVEDFLDALIRAEIVRPCVGAAKKRSASAAPQETPADLCAKGLRYLEEGDYEEAVACCRKAAEQGYAAAQCQMGLFCVGEKKYAEAIKWYRLAAEQGNLSAQLTLAEFYEKGTGVAVDLHEALAWYKRMKPPYQAGIARVEAALKAREEPLQEWFEKAEKSYKEKKCGEAVGWYHKAAQKGHAKAQYMLGYCYEHEVGIRKDMAEAAKWYRKAAEQGNAPAQNALGLCCSKGLGVSRDHAEAAKWYRLAAEQGLAAAQNNLGVSYIKGEGVQKNAAEAVKWYSLAAAQGYAIAQRNLADCYESGAGVPQNYAEAVKWYRKAAEQGNAKAQFKLGEYYENGTGVPKDLNQALAWYRRVEDEHFWPWNTKAKEAIERCKKLK